MTWFLLPDYLGMKYRRTVNCQKRAVDNAARKNEKLLLMFIGNGVFAVSELLPNRRPRRVVSRGRLAREDH